MRCIAGIIEAFRVACSTRRLVGVARRHVIVQLAIMTGSETGMIPGMPALFKNKTIGELDWDGTIVWQWGETRAGRRGAAASRLGPSSQRRHLGPCRSLSYSIPGFALPKQLDDAIYEVTPNGDIVWKWIAGDHLNEFGFTPEALAFVRQSDIPDYLHVNNMKAARTEPLVPRQRRALQSRHIVISSREANLTIIIDKKTGHVVWRLGPSYPARTLHQSAGRAAIAVAHRSGEAKIAIWSGWRTDVVEGETWRLKDLR